MGTCEGICKQSSNQDNEITIIQKQKHDTDSKTDHITSQKIMQSEVIAEEFNSETQRKTKIKTLSVHTDRKNRFMHDLEEEVKYRIKQIQLEEQENLRRIEELYLAELQRQKEEMEKKKLENQQKQYSDSFSFQNSIQQSDDHPAANPFQPKSTSQFAPKRNDNDTVSQHSQISKNNQNKEKSNSSQSDMMRKSAMMKILQSREELASNNASRGSTKKKLQLEAYEKMFSEYFSQDERGSSSQSKSVKSILKNKSLTYKSLSREKASIKSTHTGLKRSHSKKVRFSKDTNFNYERKGLEKVKKSFWDF